MMADLSFQDALTAARPRIEMQWTAMCDQMAALWCEVEPSLRAFVATCDTLTEQDWRSLPAETRRQYESWRAFFASRDEKEAE